MDETSKKVLTEVGLEFLDGLFVEDQLIPREILLNPEKYEKVKQYIPELKKFFSSSALTSLHKTAETSQKFPLLNLVRQILHSYKYEIRPVRKSDGYTADGVKKYRRFFQVSFTKTDLHFC
jgi:hypothetical protein